MLKNKLMYLTIAEEESRKYLNSATAGKDASWTKTIRDFLLGAFEVLDPFVLYGLSIAIVVCVVVYFCSKDSKATSRGIKCFFAYVIWCFLKGELS